MTCGLSRSHASVNRSTLRQRAPRSVASGKRPPATPWVGQAELLFLPRCDSHRCSARGAGPAVPAFRCGRPASRARGRPRARAHLVAAHETLHSCYSRRGSGTRPGSGGVAELSKVVQLEEKIREQPCSQDLPLANNPAASSSDLFLHIPPERFIRAVPSPVTVTARKARLGA